MLESPLSVLYNSEGIEIAVSQSQVVSGVLQPGLVMAGSGSDGRAYFLRVSNDGSVFITGSIQSTAVATQSVYVGGWHPTVTASMKLDGWSTTVTGAVSLVPSASLIVGGWAIATTGSVKHVGGATTNVSSAQASLTNFTLLSANPSRIGATFYKEGANTCYIKLGATATATSFTVRLSNNGYYELPENYTGRVDIIFSTAAANNPLYVTEITNP